MEIKEPKHLIFTYGTLRRGLHNHFVTGLDKYPCLGFAKTVNKGLMYCEYLPYVLLN